MEAKLKTTNPTERDNVMLTATKEHSANVAAEDTPLTDGFHLVIDALKANDIDTIFGLVGIPIT
ncbi:MAG: oxalyl-CoA decarboxylase, partial [Burkholderiaceae bacterium]|nr:oxalyl-CoA decarboxylase [Burkholderiaceae bacterium]